MRFSIFLTLRIRKNLNGRRRISLWGIRRFWAEENAGRTRSANISKSFGQSTKAAVPGFADLVSYWFEKARKQIAEARLANALDLLATQAIRGGVNREVSETHQRERKYFLRYE